jgi:hypothetical protein
MGSLNISQSFDTGSFRCGKIPGIRQDSPDFIILYLYPERTGTIAISGASGYELFH